ncbi:MAG: 1-deoxy-D-xylulose-5-phosphate reductoisomerase [Opitutales bacterium]
MSGEIRKNIVLLGATGSIGESTLRVIRAHSDRLRLVGVAARSSHRALARICDEFNIPQAVLTEENAFQEARSDGRFPAGTQLDCGDEALNELTRREDADLVVVAVTGARGLRPTLAAIEAGKDIALANKELLVLGGAFVVEAARRHKVRLLPTDSEHNAIFQCLQGHPDAHLKKLILTASGGQFRDYSYDKLAEVTPRDATRHPNWSMGPKITVDSATMANKGLELIEAYWLFGLPSGQLEVVIHPQSLVHSFVQFIDGSIFAQLNPPSMTFAIQHCLLFPDRAPGVDATLDFKSALHLDFKPPDPGRYPCLRLAREALQAGGTRPAVFNAANEVAVERFLAEDLSFLEIPTVIETCLKNIPSASIGASLEDLFETDRETRELARSS